MDDFERELKEIFLVEAIQIVTEAEQCYLTLEACPTDAHLIDKAFRLAHNLKGSSKAVGFDDVGHLTHELESFLLKIKSCEIFVTAANANLLLRCNDQLVAMLNGLRENLAARFDYGAILEELRLSMSPGTSSAAPDVSDIPAVAPPADEIPGWGLFDSPPSTETAETAATASAPMATVTHIGTAAPATKATATAPAATATSGDDNIRISLARLEKLIDFVGEAVILQTVLREQSQLVSNPLLRKTIHQLGKVTKEVQDISMSLRMIPLKQTFQKMQRIVRDTSSSLGKKVRLEVKGEDTELDKTILEKVSDPLVHLIRNAVDHGVESTEERLRAGKSETGTVELCAYHQGGRLVIEVRDDGAGMDAQRLRAKAVEKGILKADQKLSDKDCYALIFHPGFSTKAVVTDVSGRGVGMDVVKTNIESLQGEVLIESTLGQGSCIKIVLPLTLAIIDGMIVKIGTERYVLPLSQVHESVRPARSEIHATSGLGDIMSLRGEKMPLFRLGKLLGRSGPQKDPWDAIAIVVRGQGNPFAVLVDDIFGQSQVVIKKLGNEHRGLVGVSGSAILGDGKAALILELSDLAATRGANASSQGSRRPA